MSKTIPVFFHCPLNKNCSSYILADELELWLLLEGEDFLSRSEVETLVNSENNIDDELVTSELEENEQVNRKNKVDKIWSSVSSHFKMRIKTPSLVEYYPFEFKDKLIPKRNWQNKIEYKLYLNLLIASRLRFLDKPVQTKIASDFEKICKIAFQEWLPSFECKLFSPGSSDRRNFFGTDLRKALIKLANFMSEESHEKQIDKLDSHGDKGLDLVGVKKFSDQKRGSIVIFGQCTAKSQDLENKSLQAHAINFIDYMTLSNNPINMVFIPTFYRDENNDFIKKRPIENCLLVDRQRLLTMIKPENISQMPLSDFEII